jgi:hypothetical protein
MKVNASHAKSNHLELSSVLVVETLLKSWQANLENYVQTLFLLVMQLVKSFCLAVGINALRSVTMMIVRNVRFQYHKLVYVVETPDQFLALSKITQNTSRTN